MVAQVLKTYKEKIEYREKMIFWSLFSVFVFFLFFYGYFVNSAIMHAVHKEQMENKISMITTNITTLESQYLSLKDSITMDLALSKGFVAIPESHFAVLSPKETLSVNEN